MFENEILNSLTLPSKDGWGGYWTEKKISTFVKYLKAYLDIMSKQNFELIYFDGFAGSGIIEGNKNNPSALESIGMKVLGMNHPREFDIYYLVDLDEEKIKSFETKAQIGYPNLFAPVKKIHFVAADCNKKLLGLCSYMRMLPQKRRAIVLIDPFGMQINWNSIAACKDLGIDIWILVPTGLGMNRLLESDRNIPEAWKKRMVDFLGLSEQEILSYFYQETTVPTLFGEATTIISKTENAAQKAAELYVRQLKTVWNHVSKPLVMKNKVNSIMYHFIFASNNRNGLKIANEIMKEKLVQ